MMTVQQARQVLGLSPLSSLRELRLAYYNAVKRTHPDAGGDAAAFREVRAAYARLQQGGYDAPRPRVAERRRLRMTAKVAMLGGTATAVFADGSTAGLPVPAGMRANDRVRARGEALTVLIEPDEAIQVRGDDVWLGVEVSPQVLREGGRIAVDTPAGQRIVWIGGMAAAKGLVKLDGQGLPPGGRHARGDLYLKLTAAALPDSATRRRLRMFAAAWAA